MVTNLGMPLWSSINLQNKEEQWQDDDCTLLLSFLSFSRFQHTSYIHLHCYTNVPEPHYTLNNNMGWLGLPYKERETYFFAQRRERESPWASKHINGHCHPIMSMIYQNNCLFNLNMSYDYVQKYFLNLGEKKKMEEMTLCKTIFLHLEEREKNKKQKTKVVQWSFRKY